LTETPKLLNVVALLEDIPDHGLRRGQVGTVVEELAPDVFEVEFSDDNGRTYALLALCVHQFAVVKNLAIQSVSPVRSDVEPIHVAFRPFAATEAMMRWSRLISRHGLASLCRKRPCNLTISTGIPTTFSRVSSLSPPGGSSPTPSIARPPGPMSQTNICNTA